MAKPLVKAYVAIALLTSLSLTPPASAAPAGSSNITNDAGGGVILSLNSIEFVRPALANGFGGIVTGIGTNVTYTGGGPLLPGTSGNVTDINLPATLPLIDFITFVGLTGTLHFDLTSLGPGSANTIAPNTFNPADPISSPVADSPFILQPTATGTSITFSAAGIARDGSDQTSNWTGLFTTQVAGMTPFQVQQTLLSEEGFVSSTFSASFQITPIPEPATWMLFSAGSVCGWALRRRLRQSC